MQDATSIDTAAAWIPRWHPRLFRLARAVVYTDGEANAVVYAAYLKLLPHLRPATRPADVAHRLDEFVFLGAMRERVRLRGQMLRLLDAAADAESRDDIATARVEEHLRSGPMRPGDVDDPSDAIADRLSDMLRVVFVMLDVIGMTIAEAAAMLHIQESTVESRAQRARALVMELMKEQDRKSVV